MITLARVIVRCYPRSWRERYADEVHGLVADSGAGVRDVADLAIECVRQWLGATAGRLARPGWNELTDFVARLVLAGLLGALTTVAGQQLTAVEDIARFETPLSAAAFALFLLALWPKLRRVPAGWRDMKAQHHASIRALPIPAPTVRPIGTPTVMWMLIGVVAAWTVIAVDPDASQDWSTWFFTRWWIFTCLGWFHRGFGVAPLTRPVVPFATIPVAKS